MLSAKEGYAFQGLDIDAISDITGISLPRMDYGEQGSQHSGSVGSDNTELLLNQNISLRELDGDDSFLDSVSQVGEQEERGNQHQDFSSIDLKENPSSKEYFFIDSHSQQGGTPKHSFSEPSIMQTSSSFQEMKSVEQSFHQNTSIELGQDLSAKMNNPDKLSTKYRTRKFPSDTNIVGSGRRSVIKHHNSMPTVKTDFGPESHTSKVDRYNSGLMEKQRFINEHEHGSSRSQQVRFHPETFTKDGFQDGLLVENMQNSSKTVVVKNGLLVSTKLFSEEHLSTDSYNNVTDPPSLMFDLGNRKDLGSHERYLNPNYQERNFPQQQKGTNRGEVQDVYFGDSLQENNSGNNVQELLLGVRHDPETNELYDDKVREGADLLSRIFGGDHNSSFTSFSSTSRSSEKNDKTKPSSLHENKPQTIQRSLDSSLNSEPRIKSSSSPRQYVEQLSHSSSNSYVNRRELNVSAVGQKELPTSGSVNDPTKAVSQWSEDLAGLNNEQGSHGVAIIPRNDGDTKELVNGYIKNGYSVGSEDNIARRAVYPAHDKRSSLNNESEVTDVEEIFHCKIEELKQLELDIEEIHSRKKMAMHELNVLEETLNRNKADMNSSESLVEQYRWQATQTRSELMELEKTRNQLQEECNALNGVLEKSKRNETFNSDEIIFGRSKEEIFTCLQERDKFKKDLEMMQETLRREKIRAKIAQDDLRERNRALEDDLNKQRQETVENLQKMKEQLEKERQKVRTVQHEKLNAINNLHDEMKELQEKEIEALKAQMLRERASNIELFEEKFKREANQLKKAAENAESRIRQLEASLVERNEEFSKLKVQFREEKQKNLDLEKHWRAQLESERQGAEIRMDGQERSCKDREDKLLRQQRELENLVEERTADFRRSEERCRAQTEELQKIIENKNEEVKLVRGLVRQQEDATRVLGERLRTEAREHVRNAVDKERQSLSKEKERISRTVDEEKEKNTRTVKQLMDQIEMGKESHSKTKQTMNKLKHEAEELRKQLVEVHGERITSVQRARQEGGQELGKIKEKLQEFTIQADKLERIDKETAKAIYEECRKIAELVDMPMPFKTPTRLTDEKSGEKVDDTQESPTKEALASLRHCNNELRQCLADMKKQMDKQRTETEQIKKKNAVSSNPDESLTNLQNRLEEKEEEIRHLHQKYGNEIQQLEAEKKKEHMTYKRTVAKLEQEFQKLITAKVSVTGSNSRVSKKDFASRNAIGSSVSGPKYPQTSTVITPSRSAEKASSTDLLKHLQDRVKKLRAENENLKKSSDKETSLNSLRQTGKTRGLNNSNSVVSQSKNLSISQLQSPAKSSELKFRQSSDQMSESMEQVTRLQKLLASTTKEETNSG